MPNDKYRAYYPGQPVAGLASIAKALDVNEKELQRIANNVDKYWQPGKKLKKLDGSTRLTHNSVDPLKSIQRRIKSVFLDKIQYPHYILGGVSSDEHQKRGYLENASIHKNKKILFSEDIKNFFPNTTDAIVHSIWMGVFRFHPDVASILTMLTTYNGFLPQGWVTSSHLANLALWKYEPSTVKELERKGFVYTRFIDDVSISSEVLIDRFVKTSVVNSVISMFGRCGYRAKRTKHTIASRAGSESQKMRVGNLNVGSSRVTVPKKRRQSIRAAIFRCEQCEMSGRKTAAYSKDWHKASGMVASIKTLHPQQAEKMRKRLIACKPDLT